MACFVFLKHPFWHSPFWLLTDDFWVANYSYFNIKSVTSVTDAYFRTLSCIYETRYLAGFTAQKMKFSIKNFLSKCDQIHRKLRIWSHLLKKSWTENFIFCAVVLSKYSKVSKKSVLKNFVKNTNCEFGNLTFSYFWWHLKYDCLFVSLILEPASLLEYLKEFNKPGIVGKQRSSGILQWRIFWRKKESKLKKNRRWKF